MVVREQGKCCNEYGGGACVGSGGISERDCCRVPAVISEWVWTSFMLMASAKYQSVRGVSHQPAFMCSC